MPNSRAVPINITYLADRMAELGLKHFWVAEQIGVADRTFRRWMNGQVRRADLKNIQALAKCLQCQDSDLIAPNEEACFATKQEQIRAVDLIETKQLMNMIGATGQWSALDGIVKAVMSPHLPLTDLGKLYNLLSVSAKMQAQGELAYRYAQMALKIGTKAKSTLLIAHAQENLGVALSLFRGERDEARELLTKAIQGFHELGMFREESRSLRELGLDYHLEGTSDSAIEVLKKARRIASRLPDPIPLAAVHGTMGIVYWYDKSFDKARAEFLASLKHASKQGHQAFIHRSYLFLAHLHAMRSQWGEAKRLLDSAKLWYKTADASDLGLPEVISGRIAVLKGNFDEAAAAFERALQQNLSPIEKAFIYVGYFELEALRHRRTAAMKYKRRAAQLFAEHNSPGWVARLSKRSK